ncbi:hypothetical protein ACSDR0_45550 [Streptosporangium sp. G11]|uniref:hypothetical protein n=1 Tax=Streptosporangium sp. G11 TaxID=3436926 RepID=UPI003EBC46CF
MSTNSRESSLASREAVLIRDNDGYHGVPVANSGNPTDMSLTCALHEAVPLDPHVGRELDVIVEERPSHGGVQALTDDLEFAVAHRVRLSAFRCGGGLKVPGHGQQVAGAEVRNLVAVPERGVEEHRNEKSR